MYVIGDRADDKRQITVVLASSLHGDLLPLPLVFEVNTGLCLPEATEASKASHCKVRLAHSSNHWSSQLTMSLRLINYFALAFPSELFHCFAIAPAYDYLGALSSLLYGSSTCICTSLGLNFSCPKCVIVAHLHAMHVR